MTSQDKIQVAFTWDYPAKTALIIFKSDDERTYQMTRCSNSKFVYSTSLPPGKYHYYFIIDNKRMIDFSKPSEKVITEVYNILNINSQKQNVMMTSKEAIDNQYSMDDLIEIDNQFASMDDNEEHIHPVVRRINSGKIDNNSKLANNNAKNKRNYNSDNSNSSSIKKESFMNEIEGSFNDMESFNNLSNNKVIVYNYEDQFLIPMEIIKADLGDPNLIKLRSLENNKEYIMIKEDIFYQKVDYNIIINETYGNLIEMKEINELGILKNIQRRLRNNKAYLYVNNIFLAFYYGILRNDRDFFLSEFLNNRGRNEAVLVKTFSFNNSMDLNKSEERFIIRKYIDVNLSFIYWRYYGIIEQFLNIISIKMKYMVHLGFYGYDTLMISFIPSMSSFLASSDLYVTNIIFNKKTITLPKYSTQIAQDKFIHEAFSSLTFKNNPGTKELSALFANIYLFIMDTQAKLLRSIKDLLESLNMLNKYQNIIKLMIIAYITYNYNTIFKDISSLSLIFEGVNNKTIIYYSNMVILVMIKYINHLISEQLNFKGIIKGITNNLMIHYNPTDYDEDDILLNEVIKRRAVANAESTLNKKSISNFYKYYLNENIATFDQNLSTVDIKLISLIENIFDLDFLNFIMQPGISHRKSIILNSFNYSFMLSIEVFEQVEVDFEKIKQVWRFDLGESFETFITDHEKVSHFFQITQIIDYAKLNQGLCPNSYFRSYSNHEFFTFFFPILSDIDIIYNRNQDYSKQINKFISDIQTSQSFKEMYLITQIKIELNFKTFEIMMLLLKNYYEEHIIKLQAKIKGRIISELVILLRKSALKLQIAWRRILYAKYSKMMQNDCVDNIISKYKEKDLMILMFIIKTQNKITSLEKDKEEIDPKPNTNISKPTIVKPKEIDQISNNKHPNNIKKSQDNKAHSITHYSNSRKNSVMNTSISKSEVNSLKEKLSESREQYKELVNVIVDYEKRLENFIGLINSNQEVKDVLTKNGIQIK